MKEIGESLFKKTIIIAVCCFVGITLAVFNYYIRKEAKQTKERELQQALKLIREYELNKNNHKL